MRTTYLVVFIPFLMLAMSTSGCFSAAKLQYASGPAPQKEKRMSADEERLVLQRTNQYFAAGLAAERAGDFPGAERAYLESIQFNAKKKDANQYLGGPYHRLAVLAVRKNDVKSAELYYHNALQYGGENAELACDFAQFLCDQNRFQDAEVVMKNAMIVSPNSQKLMFFAGYTLAVQGRSVEALRFLKESIGEANAYREIAAINHSLGKPQEAAVFEERALLASRNMPQMPDLKDGELAQSLEDLEETPLELLTYGKTIANMGRLSQRFDSIRGGIPSMNTTSLGMPPSPAPFAQLAPTPVLPPPFPAERLAELDRQQAQGLAAMSPPLELPSVAANGTPGPAFESAPGTDETPQPRRRMIAQRPDDMESDLAPPFPPQQSGQLVMPDPESHEMILPTDSFDYSGYPDPSEGLLYSPSDDEYDNSFPLSSRSQGLQQETNQQNQVPHQERQVIMINTLGSGQVQPVSFDHQSANSGHLQFSGNKNTVREKVMYPGTEQDFFLRSSQGILHIP